MPERLNACPIFRCFWFLAFAQGTHVVLLFMESKKINAVTIGSEAKTVVVSGTMVTTTRRRFTDSTSMTLAKLSRSPHSRRINRL